MWAPALPPPGVRGLPYLSSSGTPASLSSFPPGLLWAVFSLPPRVQWRALLSLHVCNWEQPTLPGPYFTQSVFLNIDQWVLLPQGFFPLNFSISVKKNTVQIKNMPRIFALCSYFTHKQLLCMITGCWQWEGFQDLIVQLVCFTLNIKLWPRARKGTSQASYLLPLGIVVLFTFWLIFLLGNIT